MSLPSTPPAAADTAGPALARESRTMRLDLHADADTAFPLFGPVRESDWSPGWSPHFLWPAAPAQGEAGAVFTTGETDDAKSLWVMTDFDPRARLVRYVIVHPGSTVGELSVHVTAAGAGASTADVTYRFTALGAAGNAFVANWLAHFPHLKAHWEEALNRYLASAAPSGKP